MTPSNALEIQIEAAYNYRGHVTIHFVKGESIEGFLYNREFTNPKIQQDHFVEVFLKGSGESVRYPISALRSVELTGEDCAAGKSYEDHLKKQNKPS